MRVLIVDGSKVMRMIVLRTLRQSGLAITETHEAADGVEALAAMDSSEFDLVLSDWNMPNMSGLELLKALRAEGNQVLFGFVTSESGPAMREDAIAAGAGFLLVRPFNAEHFADVISGAVVG